MWLLTLIANQSILIHNLKNANNKPLLIADAAKMLTSPLEVADYKNAIINAVFKGTERNIESEDTGSSKNAKIEQMTIGHLLDIYITQQYS